MVEQRNRTTSKLATDLAAVEHSQKVSASMSALCAITPVSRSRLVREILHPGLFALNEDPNADNRVLISNRDLGRLRLIAKRLHLLTNQHH